MTSMLRLQEGGTFDWSSLFLSYFLQTGESTIAKFEGDMPQIRKKINLPVTCMIDRIYNKMFVKCEVQKQNFVKLDVTRIIHII